MLFSRSRDEATVDVAQQGRYDEDFAVRLYKSTDYGKTFRSIAGNIPGGPINMVREDPVSPNVLYAATDFGVCVTTNGGARWTCSGAICRRSTSWTSSCTHATACSSSGLTAAACGRST